MQCFSDFFCFSIPFILFIFWMNTTLISNFMVHLLHRIDPYCTVFGSHLLHRMHPYYTVICSHLLHIMNPQLHWFRFNFTLYYLYQASDYTISDYIVFQKYSIQCIPGSCRSLCWDVLLAPKYHYSESIFFNHLNMWNKIIPFNWFVRFHLPH